MLTLASWNIHRCIGADGRYDPERTRRVLRHLDADIIALQEIEVFHRDPGLLEFLCEGSDWRPIHGITLQRDSGHYGNAVLSRLEVLSERRNDISVPGREPRGVIDLNLRHDEAAFRVIATHLGLRPGERRRQVRAITEMLQDHSSPESAFTALMGDFNEWFPWGRPLRRLRHRFPAVPALRTFPSRRPLFALDRIWLTNGALSRAPEFTTPLLDRDASDHLPLVARLRA